ncbi:hypothetical protein AGMMS49593_03100 [Endomicrobiia bacterium]|nr:hypothetical protein AGMMS49593_03100 [Endomicrobiia bacterium]
MKAACDAADSANAFARAAATARIDALDAYNTNTFAASHKINEDTRAALDAINNGDLALTPDDNFTDNAFDASSSGKYDLAAKCYARDAKYCARAAAIDARAAAELLSYARNP